MNKKNSVIKVTSASELAKALDLKLEDAIAMEFRAQLNKKIVELVKRKETHSHGGGKEGKGF